MGGYGSIQSILDNNANLLRKKSLFKDKGKRFEPTDTQLKFKELSEEDLSVLKEQIRKESKESNRIMNYIAVIIIVVLVVFIGNYLVESNEKHEEYEKSIAAKNRSIKKEKLITLLVRGDDFFEEQHYKNALFFYKKGAKLFPEDTLVQSKIQLCYKMRCKAENKDCDKLVR